MREEFLHFIWRNKRFQAFDLVSEQNQKIEVIQFGEYLQQKGPDFFNAQLRIGDQIWAGNVEMHVNASDWYSHQHETDENYQNVILHVVWNYDIDIFRKDGSIIPVLNLSKYVSSELLINYEKLLAKKNWIFCENNISEIDEFTWFQWKEKLVLERLENKVQPISKLLLETNSNWEEVLFICLVKNFGLNVNGDHFEKVAKSISYRVITKERNDFKKLEALFFGVSGLLQTSKEDTYYHLLINEFKYLNEKHNLQNTVTEPAHFFKLRPDNFPTIRFSQLSDFLCKNDNIFSELIQSEKSLQELYLYFNADVSNYWKTHYVFDKENKAKAKRLSKSFIDLLLLNTILPLKFIYLKSIGKEDFDSIIELYQAIKSEDNSVINKFEILKIKSENAFDSQSLLHLKKNYCDFKKCLDCMIGVKLLKNNV